MQLDDDGNRTTIADGQPTPTTLVNLTFDYTNRLQSYAEVGGDTTQYRYDPFGRRIQKIGASATTLYLWDGDQLLGEYTASGDRKVRYAYAGGFAPVQVAYDDGMGGEAIYEVHTDHLDTPKLSTDDTGAVVWRAAHEAYGNAVLDPSNSLAESFNIRFPGQYYDAETGLHYNRLRYYDPRAGRYISADPIGQSGDFNVFQYANESPANFADPFALNSTSTDIEGCRLCDISPEFRQQLAVEAAAKGKIAAELGFGVPAFVCDLFEKDCLSSGLDTGTCPPDSEVGKFCNDLKALCSAASKSSSADGDFNDGGLGASKGRQGRTATTDIYSGGRAQKVP